MTEHLTEEEMQSYKGRSLSAEKLLGASNHLASCLLCRDRISNLYQVSEEVEEVRLFLGRTDSHLTYADIVAYLDRQSTSREAARLKAHVRECPSCAADLRNLESLRDELNPRPSPARHLLDWLRNGLEWKAPLALAGALACGALLIFLARTPVQNIKRITLAKSSPAPSAPQPPAAAKFETIHDGELAISLTPDGSVVGLNPVSDTEMVAVKRALSGKQIVDARAFRGLTSTQGVLLGDAGETPKISLVTPLGRVVEQTRPVFRWKASPGFEYQVSVFDDQFTKATGSDWISSQSWRPSKELRRGASYSWQLSVRQGEHEFTIPAPPAPQARFRVLSASDVNRIDALRSSSPPSHLALGVAYAKAGLLDQAQREFALLQAQNPNSQTVAALLTQVKLASSRHRSQE